MQRLLNRRVWQLRGSAAETAMLLALATLVVPLLLFLGASWLAYGGAVRDSRDRMERIFDLVYAGTRTTFETQQLIVINVATLIGSLTDEEIRQNEKAIHQRLLELVRQLPQVEDVFIVAADGRPLVAANVYPMPAGVSAADRAYFIAHRGGAARYVSETFRSRIKEVDVFQYSERRDTPDGRFDGAILVAIPPTYFVKLFEQVADVENYIASVVRADGEVLVRYPALPGGPRRLAADSGFMRAIAAQPEGGRYETAASSLDGKPRIFAYRKLPDLPVYVALGLSSNTVRNDWIKRMASHLVFGVPATLALFLLAFVAARRAQRQAVTLTLLRKEQRRRETAEESLRQSQKMNAVGQLTAGIAHDFNNLLTGIGGAIEMMDRRVAQPSAEFTRFRSLAQTGVARAATLIQRLLAFSRQQPLQIDVLDVNKLVAGMSELLRRTLGEQIRIETVLAGGLWRAKADAAQLESAILNLAINGRDAMAAGGTLTIETANSHLDDAYAAANAEVTAGQYVMIAVSDTGTGMDPDTMARAFEPFFTTKQRGQGTGLGLSMAFGYVKQIGGHLKMYSELGHGTAVKIYVPRAGDDAVDTVGPAAHVPSEAGGGPVVLVVEDDAVVRDFALSACREIGCTVYQAGDAREALAILQARPDIDLLFTDVGLPGDMNGRQLAAVATGQRPALKVLFTTGYTANAIVHHGVLDAGVNFIGKPFSIAGLAAKIKAMGF